MEEKISYRNQKIDFIKMLIKEERIDVSELFEESYRDKIFRYDSVIILPLKVMLKSGTIVDRISRNDEPIGILVLYNADAKRYMMFKIDYIKKMLRTDLTFDNSQNLEAEARTLDNIEWKICTHGDFNSLLKYKDKFIDTYCKIRSDCPISSQYPFQISSFGCAKNLLSGEYLEDDKSEYRAVMFSSLVILDE